MYNYNSTQVFNQGFNKIIIKTTTVKRELESSGLFDIVTIITIGIVSLAFILYLSSL